MAANVDRIPIARWDLEYRHHASVWRRLTAPQLFVLSFLLLVLAGTAGFKLLPGLYTGAELGWLDALFTSASACCVTGLTVVDTATYFTPWGQLYLLLLIQLGGLGMITFTSLIIVALGRRLSLRQESLMIGDPDVAPHLNSRRLVQHVVRFTLFIELAGIILLYLAWVPRFGWRGAAWPAVFHSVSAFCNAGFSTFPDSLMGNARDPAVLLIVMTLIIIGGLGFLTLEEFYLHVHARRRGAPFRLSLHTRIVVGTTAALVAGGWALFALFEWRNTLGGMPVGDRLMNALFLSVTPRTAGFNTVDYARTTESSQFLTILLMTIGGSPGSTAGGAKTTTFALVALLAWSRFRGREVVSLQGRSIPPETVQRAVGLAAVGLAVVVVGIFILTGSEHAGAGGYRFLDRAFEAFSAVNTVGLSTGLTPRLSDTGRLVIVCLMFLGRVGPLTLAAALALPRTSAAGEFRYAYEDVAVG